MVLEFLYFCEVAHTFSFFASIPREKPGLLQAQHPSIPGRMCYTQGRNATALVLSIKLTPAMTAEFAIITTETLDKLARALGVPSSELIEDVAEK